MPLDETLILRIQADEAELTVGDLKQGIRDINDELLNVQKGSERYNELVHTLGKARAGFRDIKEEAIAFNPELRAQAFARVGSSIAGGFQLATGAMALLGTESKDVEKTLLKVQAATALAMGVQSVADLGKAFNILKIIIMANPLMALATVILGITAAIIGLIENTKQLTAEENKLSNATYDYTQRAQAKLKMSKALGEQMDMDIKRMENQLKLFKETGGSQSEIFDLEKKILETRIKNINFQLSMEGGLDKARTNELISRRELLKTEIEIMDTRLKAEKAKREEVFEFAKSMDSKTVENEKTTAKEIETNYKSSYDELKKIIQDKSDFAKQKELEENEIKQWGLSQSSQVFQIVGDMQEASLNRQLAAAQGNETKQEQIRKSFFEKQKKVQIAQALMATYQGATNAFNSTAANPITALFPAAPFIAAGLAVAAGLVNVAKIRSQTYQGGNDSGGGSPSTPNISGGGTPSLPPSFSGQGTGTIADENENFQGFQGQQQPAFKTYVVESEMTDAQNRIHKIKNSATFP